MLKAMTGLNGLNGLNGSNPGKKVLSKAKPIVRDLSSDTDIFEQVMS